jgi:hypothetical protein
LTNSVGDKRSVESAPSGTSNVIVHGRLGLKDQDTAMSTATKQMGCTLKRSVAALREHYRSSAICQPTTEDLVSGARNQHDLLWLPAA